MNAVNDEVLRLIDKELTYANTKFPLFSTPHEGYGVIKEEFEETFDEIVNMHGQVALIWDGTKKNNYHVISTGVSNLYTHAVNAAIEAIQVAAMCKKYEVSLLKGE